MKIIGLNLKRFDIPKSMYGLFEADDSKEYINKTIVPILEDLEKKKDIEIIIFPPEAHLITLLNAIKKRKNIKVGCQSNFYDDASEDGNFGAFTTSRTASAMRALGCEYSLIGHFEERKNLNTLYSLVNVNNQMIVNQILNEEIKRAQSQNMSVLYCIGETENQLENWDKVLLEQLTIGLKNVDCSKIIIAYEPIWSIGPGKKSADENYINKVAKLVKEFNPKLKVIYGGGVKKENAAMLARMNNIDGGLIALTNFKENIGFHGKEFIEILDIYQKNL